MGKRTRPENDRQEDRTDDFTIPTTNPALVTSGYAVVLGRTPHGRRVVIRHVPPQADRWREIDYSRPQRQEREQ